MVTFSVVMPNYNYGRYISHAIESVLAQTVKDLELIIVDDCSSDNSRDVIERYSMEDRRVRVLFHDENQGISRSYNDGIEAAEGVFIAFLSSDDVWFKDKLSKQLEVLRNDSDLVIWSDANIIDGNGRESARKRYTEYFGAKNKMKSGNIFLELLRGNYINYCGLVLKRHNIREIKLDEDLPVLEDYKFVVDLASRYEFFFLDEALGSYRAHGKNAITRDYTVLDRSIIRCNRYFLGQYSARIPDSIKSCIMTSIGAAYSRLGENAKARQFIFNGIWKHPLRLSNIAYTAMALTSESGVIRRAFRNGYGALLKMKSAILRAAGRSSTDLGLKFRR